MATFTLGTPSFTGGASSPDISMSIVVGGTTATVRYSAHQILGFKLKNVTTGDIYDTDTVINTWKQNGVTVQPYINWFIPGNSSTTTRNIIMNGKYPTTKLTPGQTFEISDIRATVFRTPLPVGSPVVENYTISGSSAQWTVPALSPSAPTVTDISSNSAKIIMPAAVPSGAFIELNPAPTTGQNKFFVDITGTEFTLVNLSPSTSYTSGIAIPIVTGSDTPLSSEYITMPSFTTTEAAATPIPSIIPGIPVPSANSISIPFTAPAGSTLPTDISLNSLTPPTPGASAAMSGSNAVISGLNPSTAYTFILSAAGFNNIPGAATTTAAAPPPTPSLSAGTPVPTANSIAIPLTAPAGSSLPNDISLTSLDPPTPGAAAAMSGSDAVISGLNPSTPYTYGLSAPGFDTLTGSATTLPAPLPALGSSDVSTSASSVTFTLTSPSGTLPPDASLNLVSVTYGSTIVTLVVTMTPSGSNDTITITGLPRTGTEYTAVIGALGYESATVTFTTKPAVPTITAVTGGNGQITVTYNHNQGAAIAAGWKVVAYCKYQGNDTVVEADAYANGAAVSTATFTGLTNEREYSIRLSIKNATDVEGDKTEYWGSAVLVAAPLDAPTSVNAAANNAANGATVSINVSWTAPSYAHVSAYEVVPYQNNIANNSAKITVGNSPAVFTGLKYGIYTFKVTAKDSFDRSAVSTASNDVTNSPAPAETPTLVDVVPSNGALDIVFTKVSKSYVVTTGVTNAAGVT
jgi:hypothetical protein